MDQIGPKRDHKGLNRVVVPKMSFFAEILFALLEEIILNEVNLGGSPTISATLNKSNVDHKMFH